MFRPRSLRFLILSLLFVLSASLASVQGAGQGRDDREPISIRSEKMTAKNSDNRVVFEQNVVITKGDLWMKADRMEVFFASVGAPLKTEAPFLPGAAGPQEIDRIEAAGHVSLKQGDRRATAERAVYDQREDKIVLLGNPEAWEKDYKVTGTKMIFFLKEQRSIVEESKLMIQNGAK